MARTCRFMGCALALAYALSGGAQTARGWGCYAHYAVGNPVGLGLFANLPDYWGTSYSFDYWLPHAEVVPLFPWTHGCLRNGVDGGVPRTPTLHGQTSTIAERDMYQLVSKMKCTRQQVLNASLMIDTARGFLVHNSLDLHGHFALFRGGSIPFWAQHALLEEYIDFKMVDQPPGTLQALVGIPKNIGFQGHAGIILLSQKCFRKNGHTIDAVPAYSGSYEPGPVETLQATAGRLSAQVSGLSPKWYYYSRFQDVTGYLGVMGWTTTNLDAYWAAIARSFQGWANSATAALGSMPQVGTSGCLP